MIARRKNYIFKCISNSLGVADIGFLGDELEVVETGPANVEEHEAVLVKPVLRIFAVL